MNVLGDPFVFWTLRLLLFAILFICGSNLSKSKTKNFTAFLWVAIIAYALIEGLRWMRGTDYENYFIHFNTGVCEKDEPLYNIFISFVHSLNISPILVFVFLSGFFLAGLGIIFKNFRPAAIWGLPLIYLMLGYQAENLVRQYFAISFLGLAYYFYYKDETKWMLFSLLIAPLIHISGILGTVFFLLFTWKKIELRFWWLFVIVYCAAYFLWNPEWLSNVAVVLGAINVDDSSAMSMYITNAEHHFSEEGSLSAMEGIVIKRSRINVAIYFLTDLAVIIVGYFACLKNKKLVLIYLFSYIGIICQVLFGDIQVLMRFGYWFSWMCPFLVALVVIYKDYGKYSFLKYIVLFLLFARYVFYGIINNIGHITMEEGCMFIWDK